MADEMYEVVSKEVFSFSKAWMLTRTRRIPNTWTMPYF
ncbi:hypothetical protein AB434_0676 [Heyndrickxia coagulans]|uniref:Uncharacterized protein n=1 Tax=Heyndrickxia coagulans TaxID=1398 RepID=A0AAN0WA24_HEYCO|nr:hypothetical protein SB48_HM08orf00753 [Heyndrickxia coagulans]AKN53081.1 hypothetical protein AB434_0676 [Heyndrickxia coagulans]